MENETKVVAETSTEAPAPEKKKERKKSEYRTLPGSKKLLALAEDVRKNLDSVQTFNERVTAVALALNLPEKEVREKILKHTDGIADVMKLRMFIRLAILRPDVMNDSLFLCRLAQFIAPAIGEKNVMLARNPTMENVEKKETL